MQIHWAHLAYYASHRAICIIYIHMYIYLNKIYVFGTDVAASFCLFGSFPFVLHSHCTCTSSLLTDLRRHLSLSLPPSLSHTRWMPSRRTINQINQVATCHSLVLSISKLITSFNEDKRFVCSCLSLNSSSSSSTIYHAPSPTVAPFPFPSLSLFICLVCPTLSHFVACIQYLFYFSRASA